MSMWRISPRQRWSAAASTVNKEGGHREAWCVRGELEPPEAKVEQDESNRGTLEAWKEGHEVLRSSSLPWWLEKAKSGRPRRLLQRD